MGVAGSLTISLKEAGEGTDVTLTYAVGGYAPRASRLWRRPWMGF